LCLLFTGCQSKIDRVGQGHAKEVIKWQELARYAGNELKPLGITVTAEVEIIPSQAGNSFSIVNVKLNRNINKTQIDLLSPTFAEKFACGKKCENLSIYNESFDKQETQLTNFFLVKEGAFFEFYGNLTVFNETLAYYHASSPDVLTKYLNWMMSQNESSKSLSEFLKYLDDFLTEDNLLAFAKSGFISPFEDDLSPTFLAADNIDLPNSDEQNYIERGIEPDSAWLLETDNQNNDLISNEADFKIPSDDWSLDEVILEDNELTPDMLLHLNLLNEQNNSLATSYSKVESWQQAINREVQVGSAVCTFLDNTFGIVKMLIGNKVTIELIGQARTVIDGMKETPDSGHLFSGAETFYFEEVKTEKVYLLSDVAVCDIEL